VRRVRVSRFILAAGLTAAGALAGGELAGAATGGGERPLISEARATGQAADFMLRYIQEDGPGSGHIRVVLTPETRPVTVMEARMAAEQAFLSALSEPGLGDDLKRITVVVRMLPASHPDPGVAQQVIVYLHKSGNDWSVLAGE
jgi:hypothetical protein